MQLLLFNFIFFLIVSINVLFILSAFIHDIEFFDVGNQYGVL